LGDIVNWFDAVMEEEQAMDFVNMEREDAVIKKLLLKKYKDLQAMFRPDVLQNNGDIISVIKKAISAFVEQCNTPAVWCYGTHTKMLMADFIFELKKVHYIIDNGIENSAGSGFEIINESRIGEKKIDGIIISSRKYKDEIIENLKANYSHIPYLDIYAELEKAGIRIEGTYYESRHPYTRYCKLNKLQRSALEENDREVRQEVLKKIIEQYIEIKDFKSAIFYARKLTALSVDSEETWGKKLLEELTDIYEMQMEAMGRVEEDNVLILCIDGLRRKEVTEEHMKNLYDFLRNSTHYYNNAYSVSTSTFESLIPAYSENMDLRTKYYETNEIPRNGCRFINEAKKQKRKIYFYTDGSRFIEDDDIAVTAQWQTATEKLWDFLLDSVDEKNGLFYIHILYESHYSYPNPYTTDEIIAEGTSIFFDYLDKNGGQIRTDYNRQQKDALRYLDNVIVPLIEKLQCRMVLYADHGNILIGRETEIGSVEETKYTFHEDLIQVPLAIKSPEIETGIDSSLISIAELNHIIISLMNKKKMFYKNAEVIKVLRSEIYNPDFRYLYEKTGNAHGLLAFETFVFEEGYKLAVFADGTVELYLSETDSKVEDVQMREKFLNRIRYDITVCSLDKIEELDRLE